MDYYNDALSALESKFSRQHAALKYSTASERESVLESARLELSIEAGFMLLAYVESLFRSDFVLRLENRKWKDPLTLYYKDTHNSSSRPYQYSLDDIFYGWRYKSQECDKNMGDILANLPQYFKYRNWIAHGRYWVFDEQNYIRRYKFDSICILVDAIHKCFGKKFKYSPRLGDRI
jgi:hypothetical protein